MRFGYARVSTTEQTLDRQLDALRSNQCEKIFEEKMSGAATDRPELNALFAQLRPGDTVVVTSLDRLGRSLRHLMEMTDLMKTEGVEFISLKESLDTSSAGGKLVFHIMAALAEFERALITERIREGVAAARKRGRVGGRRHKHPADKRREMLEDYLIYGMTAKAAAAKYGTCVDTVFIRLRAAKADGTYESIMKKKEEYDNAKPSQQQEPEQLSADTSSGNGEPVSGGVEAANG